MGNGREAKEGKDDDREEGKTERGESRGGGRKQGREDDADEDSDGVAGVDEKKKEGEEGESREW